MSLAAALRRGTRIAACALIFSLPASALEIPAAPKGRVSDYANLLSPGAITRIESKVAAHETQSSDQIAVAIFPSLDGESLEDFSVDLARQWKIGSKENDNGVVLLVFVEDRRTRLEVGYGLEGRLTDALSDRILRQIIAPRFREGDYDRGIEDAVGAIIEIVRGEYQAPPQNEERPEFSLGTILFWGFILLFIFSLMRAPGRYWTSTMGGPFEGRRAGWSRGRGVPWWWGGGGGFGGRGGGGGGFGGGGFGGGGGGFGGGGSSGGW